MMFDYTEHTTLLPVMRRELGILVLVTKGKEKKSSQVWSRGEIQDY